MKQDDITLNANMSSNVFLISTVLPPPPVSSFLSSRSLLCFPFSWISLFRTHALQEKVFFYEYADMNSAVNLI